MEREERARQSQLEGENLSKELRYTQQTVAGELAGWQDMHERIGRRAIRELAKGMLVKERTRLEGMLRALRKVRTTGEDEGEGEGEGEGESQGAGKTGDARSACPRRRQPQEKD